MLLHTSVYGIFGSVFQIVIYFFFVVGGKCVKKCVSGLFCISVTKKSHIKHMRVCCVFRTALPKVPGLYVSKACQLKNLPESWESLISP